MSEIEKFGDDKDKFLSQFEALRPDLFFPEVWSDADRAEVAAVMRPQRIKTGMFAMIPMRCRGLKCPIADSCPLVKINKIPEGHPCPIELEAVKTFTEQYITEMRVDPENLVEVSMVRDLVDQEIQWMRKANILSREDFIQENVVGVDANGEIVLKKELHQAVEYEDRIHKRKREILKAMTATRAEKAKIGQGQIDTAQAISATMSKLMELESENEKLIRRKMRSLHDDDVIEAEIVDEE